MASLDEYKKSVDWRPAEEQARERAMKDAWIPPKIRQLVDDKIVKNKIVLVFDEITCNLDPVAHMDGRERNHDEYCNDIDNIVHDVSWVIRNFYNSIHRGYKEGAPRLIHAEKLANNLIEQMKSQLTDEQKKEFEKCLTLF